MSKSYEKLVSLLKQMFQLDQADLDFGIYRIMNYKRKEIEKFLSEDLLPQVRSQLDRYISSRQKNLKKELDDLKKTLDDTGVVYESSAKYIALKNQLDASLDIEKAEEEVYSHLTDFFSRYYNNGDFISQRRYKQGIYAIPYEGEEVKLYWANADQYYIKTAEYFRDYTFTLPEGKRVHFKLVEASTEKDNNKPAENKERKFVLYDDEPVKIENGELYIQFEFKVYESKQKDLIDGAIEKVREIIASGESMYVPFLGIFKEKPTESNPKRTLLGKHLTDYTARNTFDYFIHKDLGGFLRRELDFYLKNEVMFLDDLDTEHEVRIEQYITKIKVIKNIGHKIIAFLEQIENFQKKLWLKKKFIVETNYCITLDRIGEEFYPEIAANRAQIEEWKKLFAIEELQGYSEPLTLEFLKANLYLMLDTAFFGEEFKERLIESIDDIDTKTDGLLIKSENFQALNLLLERYKEQIKCVYIDPPYNTGNDEFIYRDNYAHSSWLSMINDRLNIMLPLLKSNSIFFGSIDDKEYCNFKNALELSLGPDNMIETLIWRRRATPPNDRYIGKNHEYILAFSSEVNNATLYLQPRNEELNIRYKNPDNDKNGPWAASDLSANGKGGRLVESCIFPIVNPNTGEEFYPPKNKCWLYNKDKVDMLIKEGRIGFRTNSGAPFLKRYLSEVRQGVTLPTIIDDGGFSNDSAKEIRDLFNDDSIEFPKPTKLMEKIITSGSAFDDIVLDFFAGSGTTAHAVINLNRIDGYTRKYVLIEMGEYFYKVTKPRIQKAIYSKDWKDGKPISREGISHMFKYIRMESYEDALNNLEIKRTEEQQIMIDNNKGVREQYILSYMLDKETEGSVSLLNIDQFADPFNYRMKIANGVETKETNVDLVETFNYLLGLVVTKIDAKESFNTEPDPGLGIPGAVKLVAARDGRGEYTFKEVEGSTLSGDKVLIIWRTLTGDIARDNAALDAYFRKKKYSTQDFEFNRIYVNGDNNLQNMRQEDERWKVLLIEEEFKRLMFDVQDI
ncbi:MAG: site-specific DNA-methyltransferase [Clostridiales bacterium]|jgi:adenine-specific DNA-methyltransferase|nr:site-specific DNA-methyltransferase [Eubacteriales bacterium]MDH7566825.1 site-specific DNA-methyltransferase [Clostridiales bacterium]